MLLELDSAKLDYCDVLIVPKRSSLSSRSQAPVTREFISLHAGKKYSCCPIIAANMDNVGTKEMARALAKHDCMTALHKFHKDKEILSFINETKSNCEKTFFTIGTSRKDFELAKNISRWIKKAYGNDSLFFVCVDVANGYQKSFSDFIRKLRKALPDCILAAGNVATGDMTLQLLENGADIVKIGIGPGSVCHTRKITGVGVPQLSAVIEAADAAHGAGGSIIADGGCTVPGDVCKAFGAGADFVMLGGMLAGHYEGTEETVLDEATKKQVVKFHGMSSKEAMEKHYGKKADYRAAEGKEVAVSYRGPVEDTIKEIQGGIRSCMTYIGARRIKDIPKCTTFIRVNRQLNTIFGA